MTNPARRRALVADDDVATREVLFQAVQRLGFDVVTFDDGEGLTRAVLTAPPDLVLTDQYMLRCNGTEAVRRFRAGGVMCPTIVVTAFPDAELAAEVAGLLGCVLLAKPLDLGALASAIQALIPRTG